MVRQEPARSQKLQQHILVVSTKQNLPLHPLEKLQNLQIFPASVKIVSAANKLMLFVVPVKACTVQSFF
jgi:hypothetical protein